MPHAHQDNSTGWSQIPHAELRCAFQSQRFKHARRAHAGADAHGHHAVFLIVPAQAMHQRGDADRAGRAQRMAERDRAAQRIDLGGIEPQVIDHREALRGESFVQLDPVELVLLQAGLLQHLRYRLDRADAHDFRRHAGDRIAEEAANGVSSKRFIAASLASDHRAGAVGHLRAVAGGHGAIRREHRLQFGEHFAALVPGRGPSSVSRALDTSRISCEARSGRVLDHRIGRDLVLEFAASRWP